MPVHVLIIDADLSAATITGAIVKRIAPDATTTYEPTPEQAWLSIQQTPPDVLIIDPASHTTNGALLIQLCQQDYPAMRVVVLASRPTPTLRAAMSQLSVDVYLEKPATLAKLTDKLREPLASRDPVRAGALPALLHPTSR